MQVILLHPDNAPNSCFEVQQVGNTDKSLFVQSDWDYPGIASTFGWSVQNVQRCNNCGHNHTVKGHPQFACDRCDDLISRSCPHDGTDGTVECKQCGMKAGEFISAAYEFLTENEGAVADDPGYFAEEEQ